MPRSNFTHVRVIFRKWRKRDGGGIIALFPTMPSDINGRYCMSYEHIGQHGGADPAIMARTVAATPKEYAPLARELRALGYRLQVSQRISARLHKMRRDAARAAWEARN